MSGRLVERTLWTGAAAVAIAALFALRAGAGDVNGLTIPALPAVAPAPQRPTTDSLEEAVGVISEHNLFRPERAMADEQQAAPVAMGMPMPPAVNRPRLVLRGVLGGPPWDAVIDGIPGREGAVVIRAGQSVAGVTVRTIRRDTVHARGFDTTWTLTLGRSW